MKPASVRFFFDADILGLGKLVAQIRSDVTFPGDPGATIGRRVRPPCPINKPNAPDVVWLPVVAARNWSVISRDSKLLRRPAEVEAISSSGARVFLIASRENLRLWEQLEVLMHRWRDIEKLSTRSGPFAYSLTRASIREIPI